MKRPFSVQTEDRDRDDPAHELHGEDRVVLADKLDDHVSELQRRACLLENTSDQSAEDDDDTDT